MGTRAITWADEESESLARDWAKRLSVPTMSWPDLSAARTNRKGAKETEFASEIEMTPKFVLVARAGQLELVWWERPEMSPLHFDFGTGILRQRLQTSGRSNPLVKALGAFRAGETIWDLSFGQGLDALLFLKMGLKVVAFERDPFVYALAQDGLRRAVERRHLQEFIDWGQLDLKLENAGTVMSQFQDSAEDRPPYVYYDPMFSRKQKSLSRKEMQFFTHLVGDDVDAGDVGTRARTFCQQRLIVKRADSAAPLLLPVTHSFSGKLVRYDMYLASDRMADRSL